MLSRNLIAIDIGAGSIKVAECGGGERRAVRNLGYRTLPPGCVTDGRLTKPDEVRSRLEDILKERKINRIGRRAALAVGGSGVMIKRVLLQDANIKNLDDQIYQEAEQHFGIDLAELYYAYYPYVGYEQSGGLPVLIAGARRELIEEHVSLIRQTNMRVGLIECGIVSLCNMFEYNFGDVPAPIAMIDVGADSTRIIVVSNGQYLYNRDIGMGGNSYTRNLMEALGVDFNNAEGIKLSLSHGNRAVPEAASRSIENTNAQLADDIRVNLVSVINAEDAQAIPNINHIILTGGGSRVVGLEGALAEALPFPIQVFNPFLQVKCSSRKFPPEHLIQICHLFATVVGLSLRRFKDSA